jgi:hypothetical protein
LSLLLALEEKLRRPGLLGLAGQKHEKALQQHLESYFRILGRRVVGLNLEELITSPFKDIVPHTLQLRLAHTIRTLTPLLKSTLEIGLQDGMLAADKIHHFAEADASTDDSSDDSTFPLGGDGVMLTGEEAALYASIHAGELVTGINSTTQQMIADIIQQGIDDSLGVDGTARLMRQLFQDMSAYRSHLIATTEMNDAFSEAAIRKLDRLGVEYKQWITATQCCDECSENEDASPILLDDDFPSGDARPPAHPNCRCAVTGARPPTVQ